MRKKALLILSITIIALPTLLPGAGAVSANGSQYYYAYGQYPSEKPCIQGHNYVYDNEVDNHFVAEFVAINLSWSPHRWIEVGWIKGVNPYPQEATFYVGW